MASLRRSVAAILLALLTAGTASTPAAAEDPPSPTRSANDDLFAKSLDAATASLRVYGPWDNPASLERVAEIGYRVAREANYDKFPISFYLIDMVEPNAFALPGGHVFVTRGMLELGLSDDELAGLLGHEVAHVVRDHGMRIERKATLFNVLSQAVLIGLAVAANNDRSAPPNVPDPYGYYDPRERPAGNVIYGGYAASLILSELLLRSYSRDFEDEADEEGQRWAAAAGYSADSTEKLMQVLGTRLPDSSREYGYWRTHPFFDERVAAAGLRKVLLKPGTPRSADDFRLRTQADLLRRVASLDVEKDDKREARDRERRPDRPGAPPRDEAPPLRPREVLAQAALTAWPKGPAADGLREDRLHTARERLLRSRVASSRDFGALLALYDEEIGELARISPGSPALPAFRGEREAIRAERDEALPAAIEVWKSGVYETPFLETFLSNYPDAPESAAVHLALGEAYSRLDRQADAVEQFLAAWEQAPEQEVGKTAQRGLKSVAPALHELTALAELAAQERDPELRKLAARRLEKQVASYSDIAEGAAYLKRFPEGGHVEAVAARLNVLAENLYGEVVLYQGIGDQLKAMDRIQRILTYAPSSPAAGKLLEKVVLPS
ncbi:MAG: M48 family metalloprotease [Thermoanaerobaculia bacterium]